MTRALTAVLIRQDVGFVALCPELDVASQGNSVEEAKANLREAVELFSSAPPPKKSETGLPRNPTRHLWR
jgi:predicted RNase H-like HicB family nuclease